MITRRNQQHNPLPKKKRVDAAGNDRRRIFAKSGNATLLLAKGLTSNACDVLTANIIDSIRDLGGTLECTFLITK